MKLIVKHEDIFFIKMRPNFYKIKERTVVLNFLIWNHYWVKILNIYQIWTSLTMLDGQWLSFQIDFKFNVLNVRTHIHDARMTSRTEEGHLMNNLFCDIRKGIILCNLGVFRSNEFVHRKNWGRKNKNASIWKVLEIIPLMPKIFRIYFLS